MIKKSIIIFAAVLAVSCNTEEKVLKNETYFDIKKYFIEEAERLQQQQPLVLKTVGIDSTSEQKTLKIKDWKKELAIFESAEINKASWKGLFNIEKSTAFERYTTNDEKVLVKEVAITKNEGKITRLFIVVHNNNSIYNSVDSLNYYPDSLYSIVKTQKIKLLEERKYQIIGKFNQD